MLVIALVIGYAITTIYYAKVFADIANRSGDAK